MSEKRITLPLDESKALSLLAGDVVRINGALFTARDAAHQRLIAALEEGEAPPFPLLDQVIYYVGLRRRRKGR